MLLPPRKAECAAAEQWVTESGSVTPVLLQGRHPSIVYGEVAWAQWIHGIHGCFFSAQSRMGLGWFARKSWLRNHLTWDMRCLHISKRYYTQGTTTDAPRQASWLRNNLPWDVRCMPISKKAWMKGLLGAQLALSAYGRLEF